MCDYIFYLGYFIKIICFTARIAYARHWLCQISISVNNSVCFHRSLSGFNIDLIYACYFRIKFLSRYLLFSFQIFVNHSIEPNTISKFNQLTDSYGIHAFELIDLNNHITFLYNPHWNIDLFIEYDFVLINKPYNQLNLEYDLQ